MVFSSVLATASRAVAPQLSRIVADFAGRRGAQRAADVVLGLAGMGILLPLLALIAAVVWVENPGPVLVRQRRIGLGRAAFDVLRFRTARMGGMSDPPSDAGRDNSGVTPVGALLRRTYLDELPQLVNVLRGDLSLFGSRTKPDFSARGLVWRGINPI